MSENRVIVRDCNGRGAIRRVLDLTDKAAFVCAPEHFDAIKAGQHPAPLAGFPLEDVFEFDAAAERALEAGRRLDWSKLRTVSRA